MQLDLQSVIKTLSKWVEIKSVKSAPENGAPFGKGVNDMLIKALSDAKEMGFETKNYNGFIGEVIFGNGNDEEGIAILCHLDVVPEGDLSRWEYNPYKLTEKDGFLYGRGVLDDKGASVVCLYALKSLKDEGFIPSKKIKLIFGLDEESGWGCIDHYNKVAVMPKTGFSPDGEFPVLYAEKGIYHIKYSFNLSSGIEYITGGDRTNVVCDKARLKLKGENERLFSGVSAHGSTPEKGDNAIKKALLYLVNKGLFNSSDYENLFNDKLFENVKDESGPLTFSPNVIVVENGKIVITVDVRYPATYSLLEIEKLLRKVGDFEVLSHHKPLFQDKNGELVTTLSQVYEKYTGVKLEPTVTGGGTYARALKNGVAFGPAEVGEECCHEPNERISLKTLEKCFYIYKNAIKELSK